MGKCEKDFSPGDYIHVPYNMRMDDYLQIHKEGIPDSPRQSLEKYTQVYSAHLVVNDKKVLSGIIDGGWGL